MAKKKNTDGVWFLEIYRFGYFLKAVGRTEEEVLHTMQEEYIKTYAKYNELNEDALRSALVSPLLDEDGEVDEYAPENEFVEYFRSAFEDNEQPQFIEFGKVEWE